MNAQSLRERSRAIGTFSIVQMAVALALTASGFVHVLRGPRVDSVGVLAGIAVGVLLYYLLASGDLTTPLEGRRGSLAVLAALLAGNAIAEELLWRGFALDTIRTTAGEATALVATTVGFAASHAATQGWSGIRYHLVTGLVMGLTCIVTGSLVSAIATHLSYNLMFVRRIARQGSL